MKNKPFFINFKNYIAFAIYTSLKLFGKSENIHYWSMARKYFSKGGSRSNSGGFISGLDV